MKDKKANQATNMKAKKTKNNTKLNTIFLTVINLKITNKTISEALL